MISKEELKMKTGYNSFLAFKRSCQGSAESRMFIGLTTYYYDKNKHADLAMRPEELFMKADSEIESTKKVRKRPTKPHTRG